MRRVQPPWRFEARIEGYKGWILGRCVVKSRSAFSMGCHYVSLGRWYWYLLEFSFIRFQTQSQSGRQLSSSFLLFLQRFASLERRSFFMAKIGPIFFYFFFNKFSFNNDNRDRENKIIFSLEKNKNLCSRCRSQV